MNHKPTYHFVGVRASGLVATRTCSRWPRSSWIERCSSDGTPVMF
jgi:hypothetical protein